MLAGMTSPLSTDRTGPDDDLDGFVRRFIAAIEANDLESACSWLSADCVYDNVPMGPVVGPEAVRAGLAPFIGACTEVDWVIHHQVARQDSPGNGVVMNERLDRFHLGGRWVEVPVAGLFVVRDGLISLWRDYFDLATYRQQMAPPA